MTDRPAIAPDVLGQLGLAASDRLGGGGEAEVFALDDDRVVRVCRPGTTEGSVRRRVAFSRAIAERADAVPFDVPAPLELRTVRGHWVVVERRLPGRPMMVALEDDPPDRAALVRGFLDASAAIRRLTPSDVPADRFGNALADRRFATSRAHLAASIRRSLAIAGPDFAAVDVEPWLDALDEPERAELVHFDVFAGNVLCDASRITAVLDFSVVSILGDARLDPLLAAAYLTPHITPPATPADADVAADWLDDVGLGQLAAPARSLAAAFWAGAVDDRDLHAWCRDVLLSGGPGGP